MEGDFQGPIAERLQPTPNIDCGGPAWLDERTVATERRDGRGEGRDDHYAARQAVQAKENGHSFHGAASNVKTFRLLLLLEAPHAPAEWSDSRSNLPKSNPGPIRVQS